MAVDSKWHAGTPVAARPDGGWQCRRNGTAQDFSVARNVDTVIAARMLEVQQIAVPRMGVAFAPLC
jgi:hypothetical protein